MTFAPFSGSLLRLALTTLAFLALLAAGLACWEQAIEHSRLSSNTAPPSEHSESTPAGHIASAVVIG